MSFGSQQLLLCQKKQEPNKRAASFDLMRCFKK